MSNAENVNIILQGVVGSTAYGLSTPDSDVDRAGIFQRPVSELIGFKVPRETIVEHEPGDRQLQELGKFMRLAAKANPTIMELLWLPEYEILSPEGEVLIANREAFLSQRLRTTYVGYVKSQLGRLLKRGDFSSDLKKRTEKHGRHCARLLVQAHHALVEGEIRVRLSEEEAEDCRFAGQLAAGDPEGFAEGIRARIRRLDDTPSSLPEHPDEELLNYLLVLLRMKHL